MVQPNTGQSITRYQKTEKQGIQNEHKAWVQTVSQFFHTKSTYICAYFS